MPNEREFEQFLQAHAPCAWRVAMSLTGNAADADDAMQEAAIVVARRLNEVRPENPGAWFSEVVANACRNLKRGRRRRQARESAMPSERTAQSTPDQQAGEAELAADALAALGELPEDEREAVTLVHLGGMTIRQAAECAGVAATTLSDRVSRGVARLRRRMGVPEGAVVGIFPVLPFAAPPSGWSGAQAKWKAAGMKALGVTPAALTVGGIVVSKKILVSVVVLILVVLACWYAGQPDWWFALDGQGQTDQQSEVFDGIDAFPMGGGEPLPEGNSPLGTGTDSGSGSDSAESADAGEGTVNTNNRTAPGAGTDGNSESGSSAESVDDANEERFKSLEDRLVRRIGGPSRWRDGFGSGDCVALDPRDELLAVGGYPGQIQLRSTTTGRVVRTLRGHPPRACESLNFSTSGRLLASGGSNGFACLWEVATGKLVRSFLVGTQESRDADPNAVECVYAALTPDERQLVTVSTHVQVWDAETGELLHTFAPARKNYDFGALSGDGQYVAVCDSDAPEIWSVALRKLVHTLKCELDDVVEQDNRAVFDDDEKVPAPRNLACMKFTPRGDMLAAGARERLFLWQTSTGQQLREARHETGGAYEAIGFRASDGMMLTYNSAVGLQVFRDPLASPQPAVPWGGSTDILFSPSGNRVYVQHGPRTFVLDAETLELLDGPGPEDAIHEGTILHVRFSPDGQHIASASVAARDEATSVRLPGDVKYWSLEGEYLWTHMLEDYARDLSFLPDGSAVVVTDGDVLRVVDTGNGALRHGFELYLPSGERVTELGAVAVSADGLTAAVGCKAQGLLLVNLASGHVLQAIDLAVENRKSLCWLPDGKRMAAYSNQKIHLVNWETGEYRLIADSKSGRAFMTVSADGKYVAASTGMDTAGVWEIESGESVSTTVEVPGTYGPDPEDWRVFDGFDARFSPDGKRLILGGMPGEVRVFDVATGKLLEHFGYSADNLWCLDISPDGRYAVTSMIDDESISIWRFGD